jgi:hypothetical protein
MRHFSSFWPRYFSRTILSFTPVMLLSAISLAQKPASAAPAAPIPAQILTAKKIFIANAGAIEMDEDAPHFSGGPDRAYDEIYSALTNWGRYQIVSSPADADLLLEISLDSIVVDPKGPYIPQFRLKIKIRDSRTNALLWSLNTRVEFGMGQAASDRNFDQAIDRLTTELKMLVAQPVPIGGGGVNR